MSLAIGKSVLDVGVVDHDAASSRPQLLHRYVADVADSVVGVDVEEEGVERLRQAGYNVRQGDATSTTSLSSIGSSFQLIVCGEVVEHVGTPELMLRSLKQVLAPKGRIVMTTPNVLSAFLFGRFLFNRWRDSADHVVYLTPSSVAELADRVGLRLCRWRGALMESATWKHRAALRAGKVLSGVIQPEVFCTTMIFELEHDE